jgi:putative transcriptional regulator
MGLVINQSLPDMRFTDILEEMELGEPEELIKLPSAVRDMEVLGGGPVERERGFVLHSADYFRKGNSFAITDDICLTATIDALKAISFGPGPQKALFVLGYCGWAAGQLEDELKQNGWLTLPQSHALLFEVPIEARYNRALTDLGANRASLSPFSGSA